jgi:hypothetical protein
MDLNLAIEDFESDVLGHQHDMVAKKLIGILSAIDQANGGLEGIAAKYLIVPQEYTNRELERTLSNRLASAIGLWLIDPTWHVEDESYYGLMSLHRWIGALFASTPFRNADHFIRLMGATSESDPMALDIQHPRLMQACLLFSLESDLSLGCDELWYRSPLLCSTLMLALLAPRLAISSNAHAKRELLLQWFPDHLEQMQSMDYIPASTLHDVYMHCSYGTVDSKHNIKKGLNRLIRGRMEAFDIADQNTPWQSAEHFEQLGQKPVLMVVLEWFHCLHSIYRTHSLSIESLTKKFHVVGVGFDEVTDQTTRSLFNEFEALTYNKSTEEVVRDICDLTQKHSPQVIYYPSLGMFHHTVYCSNLRLAPVQIMALGHPATSLSTHMDFVIVEDDFVGDPNCFSERLIRVPSNGNPYRPPAIWPQPHYKKPRFDQYVHVGVVGAIMKLNYPFLKMCLQIQKQSTKPVQFHFVPAFALGLSWLSCFDEIKRLLPNCVVHDMMDLPVYLECIAQFDLFINPYPFGNTNTIVDCVGQGVPGVCRRGPEVHSSIDAGLFKRLGFPDWLVADNEAQMIKASLRLIENENERSELQNYIAGIGYAAKLFEGDASQFCDAVYGAYERPQ